MPTHTTINGRVCEYPDPPAPVADFMARLRELAAMGASRSELQAVLHGPDNPLLEPHPLSGYPVVTRATRKNPVYHVLRDIVARSWATPELIDRLASKHTLPLADAAAQLGITVDVIEEGDPRALLPGLAEGRLLVHKPVAARGGERAARGAGMARQAAGSNRRARGTRVEAVAPSRLSPKYSPRATLGPMPTHETLEGRVLEFDPTPEEAAFLARLRELTAKGASRQELGAMLLGAANPLIGAPYSIAVSRAVAESPVFRVMQDIAARAADWKTQYSVSLESAALALGVSVEAFERELFERGLPTELRDGRQYTSPESLDRDPVRQHFFDQWTKERLVRRRKGFVSSDISDTPTT